MTPTTREILKRHTLELQKINNQRRRWLYASSIVLSGIIILIFTWDWLDHFHSDKLWWTIISLMLIISVNWWYWTMRVIRLLLEHNQASYDIMHCLLSDVSEARIEIQNLAKENLDRLK